MADPEIISAIQEGFRSVAGMLGVGSTPTGGNSAGGGSGGAGNAQMSGLGAAVGKAGDGLGELAKKVVPAYLGLEKLTTGADVGATALGAFKSALGSVNLGALGGVVDKTLGSVIQWKSDMDTASREMGIGANNLGKFVSMSAEAGLTTKQFSEVLKNSGVQSLGLGANAQKGAEAFSAIASQVQQSAIGQQLQDLGMTTQELADITALSASQNARANMTTKEAAMAAERLASELDETSRLTGVSREQLAKTLKEDEKRADIIALERSMSKSQLEGYQNTKNSMAMFGTSMVQLTGELAAGKLSEAGRAQLAALGPAGRELESALKAQQRAAASGDATEKARADAMLKSAQAHISETIMSEKFNKEAVIGQGKYRDAQLQMIKDFEGAQNVQKGANEAAAKGAKHGEEYNAALEKNTKDVKNLREGKDETGKADQSQNLSRMLNEANREATVQAKGLAKGFDDLNKAIGPVKDKMNPMADAGGAIYKGGQKAVDLAGKANTGAEAYEAQRKIPEEGAKILDDMTKGIFGKATETAPLPSGMVGADGRIKKQEPPGRDGGTLAKTGSPVEPQDAIVKIHKGETVLNPEATKGLGKQFTEISNSISTSVSSVSGGGYTENKQLQNDSSKAAEKELASIRDQMQAERAALREKLKAQMGDGSKLGGNAVAKELRTGDEGKALVEKYQAMMEPLQKQIDAGISFETTKKASAVEESKKIIEEQTKVLFSGNAKQLDALKSKEKAEDDFYGVSKKQTVTELADQTAKRDEIFKAAEAARSIVGTSIKGLSDDAIEAMIPVGASMDDFYIGMDDTLQSWSNDSATKLKKITDDEQASSSIKITASETARKVTEDMGLKTIESTNIAGKAQEQYHSQFTESQQKIIDDYKGYSEENRSFHAKAMEKGAKEDAETAQMIGDRIVKMKEAIGDRQATTEELAAIKNEELNKAMFEKQAASKREMQDVMENLNEYSVAREKELKQQAAQDISSIQDEETTAKIDEAKSTMAKSMGGMLDMPGVPKAKEASAADLKAEYAKMSTDMNATPEGLAALKSKMDAKVAEESAKKPGEMGYATQQLDKLTGGFGKIGGGDMFAPKIVDQKAADAQKAKIAEAKAVEAKKPSEAAPKKTEADKAKETDTKKATGGKESEQKTAGKAHDATLKDLNDQLVMLNKHMVELINHSEKSADANSKTAKATQKATGTR
jgi:hypothetical protein